MMAHGNVLRRREKSRGDAHKRTSSAHGEAEAGGLRFAAGSGIPGRAL